jgi:hypothetical protein
MSITVTTAKGKTWVFKWRKSGAVSVRGNVVTFRSGCYNPASVPRAAALAQIDSFLRRKRDSRVTPAT